MKNVVLQIQAEFIHKANGTQARKMEQYLKNLFSFYGIASPLRKSSHQPFLKLIKYESDAQLWETVRFCWAQNEREMHYLALEILIKFKKKINIKLIHEIEFLIVNKSWWDTVDTISSHLVGEVFLKHPAEKQKIIEQWLNSGNFWLQRACIIHQLKYKDKVDEAILEKCILHCTPSKEFFINKAVGWALREYSKVNSEYVRNFLDKHTLAALSRKEASKYLS